MRTDRKTVQQVNIEAAELIAHTWLDSSEKILKGGQFPMPLSRYDRDDARLFLLPEYFWAKASAWNHRWWFSERNWEVIRAHALAHARHVLTVVPELYPLTRAHFTRRAPTSSTPQDGH